MGVETALLVSSLAGAGASAYSASQQGKAAQAQADAANQPGFRRGTTTTSTEFPDFLAPFFPFALNDAFQAYNTPLPELPGISYNPEGSASAGLLDQILGEAENSIVIPKSEQAIAKILNGGSLNQFITEGEEALDPFLDQLGSLDLLNPEAISTDQFDSYDLLESIAGGSGLRQNPFLAPRLAELRRETDDQLEATLAQARSLFGGSNRAGGVGEAIFASRLADDALGSFGSAAAGLQSDAFNAGLQQQTSALSELANLDAFRTQQGAANSQNFFNSVQSALQGFGALRNAEVGGALSAAPGVEAARLAPFLGGIPLATAIDGHTLQADALAQQNYLLEAQAPFLRNGQFLDTLLPLAQLLGRQVTEEDILTSGGQVAPAYTQDPFSAGLFGGLGGAGTGYSLWSLFNQPGSYTTGQGFTADDAYDLFGGLGFG